MVVVCRRVSDFSSFTSLLTARAPDVAGVWQHVRGCLDSVGEYLHGGIATCGLS